MKILAIETSCDETGIALVEGTNTDAGFAFTAYKNALLSQALLHSPYGGVYPNLAKREHLKNLPALFQEFADENFDAIVVTEGPGLEPALWTGIEFAKKLAAEKQRPLFGVNHMEGHLLSSLTQGDRLESVALPVLGLLISGGHTEFVLMKDWFEYDIVGETLDDAVGECFDKVARMLGLPYPGGPEISKLAQFHREKKSLSADFSVNLPRPMLGTNTCDMSFSGLKTAALYALRDAGKELSNNEKAAFAAEFEETVGDVFVTKTRKALEQTGAKTFVIGGGVAANRYLRERLQALVLEDFSDVELRLPHLSITGDNAIMIAEAALVHLLTKDWGLTDTPKELKATGNLSLQK